MSNLTPENSLVIAKVANKLGIPDPQWLVDLIAFETGGTFDPKISNPRSSAKGLIQFIDSTAQGLGYASSQDLVNKHPTFESQMLGPVTKYLSSYAPFNSEYQLYMSVFYPAARKFEPDTTFKEIFATRTSDAAAAERAYKTFINANTGIFTPQHYVDFAKKKTQNPLTFTASTSKLSLTALALVATTAYYLFGWKKL
jgi:hypothetical protein